MGSNASRVHFKPGRDGRRPAPDARPPSGWRCKGNSEASWCVPCRGTVRVQRSVQARAPKNTVAGAYCGMPRRASPLRIGVRLRPLTGKRRAAVGAGLLLVVLGASACSPSLSSTGRPFRSRSRPRAEASSPARVCSMRRVRRPSPADDSAPRRRCRWSTGSRSALQLQLRVVSSKSLHVGHLIVRSPGLGENIAGVSVGQTSWHLATTVEQLPGVRPTRCEVTYGAFG